MKPYRSLIFILLLVGILLLIKHFFFPAATGETGGPPGSKGGPPAPQAALVGIEVVQNSSLDNRILTTGTILANESVDLRSEISGRITRINFSEGAAVSKGQLLIQLQDEDLRYQLNKLTAEIKLAEEKLSRYNQLLSVQGVSREELDMASNQLNALKAEAGVLKVQISKTSILAPFNGVLGLRAVSEGSYITPQQTITTIQQLDPVKIEFTVPERYSGMVKTGTLIHFSIENSKNSYTGTVYATESFIDVATRSMKVRARAANPGNLLKPGAFARIELNLNTFGETISIPTQAIIPVMKGQQVFVCRMGKADVAMVETGIRSEKTVQILSGLKPGDSLIVNGMMGLRPGMPLKFSK